MMHVLQGDAYTGNWLSAIRHTPKLARRMIVSTMSLVAELYPDKTHVLYGPRHAVIHCNTLLHSPPLKCERPRSSPSYKDRNTVSTKPTCH